jgi:hypothetical protein
MTKRTLHAFILVLTIALTFSASSPANQVVRPMRFFDTNCKPGQLLRDDPLKFPGMPGGSHEHQFLGNTATNASSTGASLLLANRDGKHTTCSDPQDGSAYWLPALYRDGKRLDPAGIHVYYMANQQVGAPLVKAFPVGFGQIAGPNGIDWKGKTVLGHEWRCVEGEDDQPTGYENIDSFKCSTGKLRVGIHFAECWDGVNNFKLDESHVAHQSGKECPPDHPYLLPGLSLLMGWRTDTASHTYQVAMGADGALGTTASVHADFFSAWDPAHLQELVTRCLNKYPQDEQLKTSRPQYFSCNRR